MKGSGFTGHRKRGQSWHGNGSVMESRKPAVPCPGPGRAVVLPALERGQWGAARLENHSGGRFQRV